jgi:hypothetical protein
MFLVFLLVFLVNSLADNDKFILKWRYEVAGLPINVLDFGIVLLLAVALATLNRPKYQTDRTHPLLFWSIGLLAGSLLMGVFGSLANGIPLRFWATGTRNLMMLPLCIFLGYHLISAPRMALWTTWVVVIGSIGSAIFVLLFVRESAEMLNSFDRLRKTSYGGDSGLYAMSFLAFTVVAGIRFAPRLMTWLLIPFLAVCYFSLPHRSSWVAGAGTLLFAMLVLPKVSILRRVGYTWVVQLTVGVCIIIGIGMYSQLTDRDFGQYVEKRLRTLMPWKDEDAGARDVKAWDSRIPGAVRELKIWMESPLTGQGFGNQADEEKYGFSEGAGGFSHNVWTASLAESGILGLLGYTLPPITMMLIGWRMIRQSNDRNLLFMGALGAVVGCSAFLLSFMTLSINTQRQAITLGLMCGMLYRCRAIQLTMAREYAGYLDEGELPVYEQATEADVYAWGPGSATGGYGARQSY